MSWKEISPGTFQSTVDTLEGFYVVACTPTPTGREHWTIALNGVLEAKDLPANTTLESRLRDTWLALLFEHPSLACEIDREARVKTYKVKSSESAKAWVDSNFQVHDASATLTNVVNNFTSREFPVLHYLPHSSEIVFQISHWRTDGRGSLMLMDRFFELFTTNRPPAVSLPWGTESKNLTPSFEVACHVPSEPTEYAKKYSQDRMGELATAFPNVGLPLKEADAAPTPAATVRKSFIFTEDSTKKLLQACHDNGFSITSALQAAVVQTIYAFAPAARQNMPFTSMMSMDLRSGCPPPLNGVQSASSNCLGGQFVFSNKDESADFHAVARSMNWQMREKFQVSDWTVAVREVVNAYLPLLTSPPPPDFPPPSDIPISSPGIFDDFVRKQYGGRPDASACSLSIRNVRMSLEMTTPQIFLHVYTWNNRFHLTGAWNEVYYDKVFAEKVVGHVKGCFDKFIGYELETEVFKGA